MKTCFVFHLHELNKSENRYAERNPRNTQAYLRIYPKLTALNDDISGWLNVGFVPYSLDKAQLGSQRRAEITGVAGEVYRITVSIRVRARVQITVRFGVIIADNLISVDHRVHNKPHCALSTKHVTR